MFGKSLFEWDKSANRFLKEHTILNFQLILMSNNGSNNNRVGRKIETAFKLIMSDTTRDLKTDFNTFWQFTSLFTTSFYPKTKSLYSPVRAHIKQLDMSKAGLKILVKISQQACMSATNPSQIFVLVTPTIKYNQHTPFPSNCISAVPLLKQFFNSTYIHDRRTTVISTNFEKKKCTME